MCVGNTIEDNIKKLKERIITICSRINRKPEEIEVVAVSKGVDVERIKEAINKGIKKIGENRVQEAIPKIEAIGREVEWHMVGHLQTNKVKKAVKYFDFIQSVDSERLVEFLEKEAGKLGKKIPVLVEVNTSGEETKFGIAPEQCIEFVNKIVEEKKNLLFRGLMTVGPLTDDKEKIRRSFALLRKLKEKIECGLKIKVKYLSMGMTDDYEIAIEEGSNMLRIGRGIFGKRY